MPSPSRPEYCLSADAPNCTVTAKATAIAILPRTILAPRLQTRSRTWHALTIAGIAVAMALIIWLVHASGGFESPYTNVMMLPLLMAAAAYGLPGGLATGVVGALLAGPFFPGSTADTADPSINEWLVHLGTFIVVGLVAGGWTDRLRGQARAERDALRRDPPTGLGNQAAFFEDVAQHLATDSERELAVVLVRATDLGDVVDVTGIEGGDRLIRELGLHLSRVCPEVAEAYRFSASELALIVEPDDEQSLQRLARTLHTAAASSLVVDGAPVRIEPALGIGHIGQDAPHDADELVRRARIALRRAISLDRDWVSYEPTLESDAGATIELIARAQEALDAGEFELHYQPKVWLSDGRPAGVEALVRWRRPDHGMVAPGTFMPKLERTSLIDAFSRFVIRTATDFARTGLITPVSINLAPRNLADEMLVNTLIQGLRETATPPEYFEVEVTESALMRDPESTITLLRRLRDHGVGVSIDDFGTGYASFAYLRRLPATNLKIDRAFVRPLEGDPKTSRLVLAMVEAGHALGLTVTAEGVETQAQARILAELGCDLGQGFLWSAARPQTELGDWLEDHAGHGASSQAL